MARERRSVTSDRRIRDLKSAGKDQWFSAGVRGLYLRLRDPGGSKVFVYRTQHGGKNRVETLGEWSEAFHLEDAQRMAQSRRGVVPVGKHTVRQLAERFYSTQIEPRRKDPEAVKRYVHQDIKSTPMCNWRA